MNMSTTKMSARVNMSTIRTCGLLLALCGSAPAGTPAYSDQAYFDCVLLPANRSLATHNRATLFYDTSLGKVVLQSYRDLTIESPANATKQRFGFTFAGTRDGYNKWYITDGNTGQCLVAFLDHSIRSTTCQAGHVWYVFGRANNRVSLSWGIDSKFSMRANGNGDGDNYTTATYVDDGNFNFDIMDCTAINGDLHRPPSS